VALLPPEAQEVANERIDQIIDDFGRIARGMLMLGEKPPRSVDDAVTTGEKLSVLLCTVLLRSRGAAAEAIHGTDLIVTDEQFGDASPIIEATSEKTRARLQPLLDNG
jgi:aspartate kinase